MRIPLFKIYWDEEDLRATADAISSGMRWCIGPHVEEFERKIAAYLNSDYCVTFNSGGSALHALMAAYGFGAGDEIIVPSFTFIATALAPLYTGSKPVFADIEDETMGLDPDDVNERITPRTRAIIPIHYGGAPCRIRELREIADDHDLILIEDAAEAFGATFRDKHVGTIGDSAIFSFCQNKIFTTSEGGCAVTDDPEIYEKLKLLVSYGRVDDGNYFNSSEKVDYIIPGYNWRLSSILASLGISQLEKVDSLIDMRRRNAEYLNRKLGALDGILTPVEPADCRHVYQMYTIQVMDGKRDELMSHLQDRGVSSKVYFDPAHRYTVFNDDTHLPVTDRVSSRVLTLPMYPHMDVDELEYIASSVREFFED